MASVNKTITVGNLCADPDLKTSGSGSAVCKLRIATNRVWTNKDGKRQEEAEFHRVTVFGKQGESCAKYLRKGRQVYVEGRLKTSQYEKDGQTHYSTEIVADTVQFLGGKGDAPAQDTGAPDIYIPSEQPDDDIPF